MDSRRYKFKFEGISALLFHADDIEASDTLKEWRDDPDNKNFSVKGDDRSPAWTWQTYFYNDGVHISWPSANIMSCLRSAGTQVIMKKQKTFKEMTQSGMGIDVEHCVFTYGGKQLALADVHAMKDLRFKEQAEAVKALGFVLFLKRARVGQSKHVRVRPRFDQWTVSGDLDVRAEEITEEALQRIFTVAGTLGFGDWRPGCKTPGPYGRFHASLKRAKG